MTIDLGQSIAVIMIIFWMIQLAYARKLEDIIRSGFLTIIFLILWNISQL